MAPITGIKVELKTANEKGADTDAPIFIGVSSTTNGGGGREFTLDTAGDDFKKGEQETFILGNAPGNGKVPQNSKPGEVNDPQRMGLELNDVNQVYIRKQGDLQQKGKDDPYKLESVKIELYAGSGTPKVFQLTASASPLWLGNQFGHQAWLSRQS